MHTKAFNSQAFLEFLCFSILGGLLFYLTKSGKYLSYVTPRMEPYIYFASIVMGIWAFSGLSRLFRPQYKVRSFHCFVLGIPILLLLLPHSPLTVSNLVGNYTAGNAFSASAGQGLYSIPVSVKQSASSSSEASDASDTSDVTPSNAPSEDSSEDTASSTDSTSTSSSLDESELSSADTASTDTTDTTATDTTDTQSDLPEEQALAALPGLDAANKKIVVSNDDFSMWFTELYTNIKNYKGYTIVMTGYVFKDPNIYKEDEFVPARLMMSCCVADLSPAGIVCKYDKASELKENSWVTVEGTLHVGQYEYEGKQYKEPQIFVTKITPAKEVKGYVYPFY